MRVLRAIRCGYRTIISLVACTLVLIWIRSHFYYDDVVRRTKDGSSFILASYGGWMCFSFQGGELGSIIEPAFVSSHHRLADDYRVPEFHHPIYGVFLSCHWDTVSRRLDSAMVNIQYRLPLTIVAFLSLYLIGRSIRLRIRRVQGRCATCGYDLRGQKDRCSECGCNRKEKRDKSGPEADKGMRTLFTRKTGIG